MYGVCPVGNYCPVLTAIPIPCPDGTYMSSIGASVCLTCPAGYYCQASISTSSFSSCPLGYYCPAGTAGTTLQPCPAGRFGNQTNLQAVDDCRACPPGQYCSQPALTSPSGSCAAGYYCVQGSLDQFGSTLWLSNNTCPIGYYCPGGSPAPTPCPPGTYNPRTVPFCI